MREQRQRPGLAGHLAHDGGSAGCGGTASRIRATLSSSSRAWSSLTGRIFKVTSRSCRRSGALTMRPSPPIPSNSRISYLSLISAAIVALSHAAAWFS